MQTRKSSIQLNTRQAAKVLGLSMTYLRNMRQGQCTLDGPKWHYEASENGITAFYAYEDLVEWKKKPW